MQSRNPKQTGGGYAVFAFAVSLSSFWVYLL